MPNWCANYLTVRGPEGAVRDFLVAVCADPDTGEGFSLERGLPMPVASEDGTFPDGFDVLEWCRSRWGTKWEVDADVLALTPGEATWAFSSAWSPPDLWLAYMVDRHPDLTMVLESMELGVDFIGVAVGSGGHTTRFQWGASELHDLVAGHQDIGEPGITLYERFRDELEGCLDDAEDSAVEESESHV